MAACRAWHHRTYHGPEGLHLSQQDSTARSTIPREMLLIVCRPIVVGQLASGHGYPEAGRSKRAAVATRSRLVSGRACLRVGTAPDIYQRDRAGCPQSDGLDSRAFGSGARSSSGRPSRDLSTSKQTDPLNGCALQTCISAVRLSIFWGASLVS